MPSLEPKANKWKCNVVGKEEKLSKAVSELNENTRQFKVFREIDRKFKVEVEACKREQNDAKDEYAHELENMKHDLDSMVE